MALERFPKAYNNKDFLNSSDARTIRLLAEYLEPLSRFKRLGVWDSVIFFGSARIKSREEAQAMHDKANQDIEKFRGKNVPDELQQALKTAEIFLRNARYYEEATELSRMLSEWFKDIDGRSRFVVSSGGGPGIMEAANRGAKLAGHESVGLNISLPFEQAPNDYISPELNFEFHYFFMRKFWFVYPARAAVIFPGGFGTMDEMMEILTLIQTQKLRKHIVLILYGSEFWNKILNFQGLVDELVISPQDLELFRICDTPQEAFNYLQSELTTGYLDHVQPET
jgi:uncharacterized protein (TIGR00730 family)